MSHRSFEDRHGLIKHFSNRDIEFEVVMAGLDALKGSAKFGRRARELEQRFLVAHDGVHFGTIAHTNPGNSTDQYLDQLRSQGQFIACDELQFRLAHNDCMVFFREVRDAFNILTLDDTRK